MKLFAVLLLLISASQISAWEDHPDIQDHSETDRLFKLAQKQTGADEIENLRGAPIELIKKYCEKHQIAYEEIKDVIK